MTRYASYGCEGRVTGENRESNGIEVETRARGLNECSSSPWSRPDGGDVIALQKLCTRRKSRGLQGMVEEATTTRRCGWTVNRSVYLR